MEHGREHKTDTGITASSGQTPSPVPPICSDDCASGEGCRADARGNARDLRGAPRAGTRARRARRRARDRGRTRRAAQAARRRARGHTPLRSALVARLARDFHLRVASLAGNAVLQQLSHGAGVALFADRRSLRAARATRLASTTSTRQSSNASRSATPKARSRACTRTSWTSMQSVTVWRCIACTTGGRSILIRNPKLMFN
jgi:hypothetical protein